MTLSKVCQSNFPHQSVLSLSNAIVGASVLSMPFCFQQCGIVLATLLTILCGFITSYSFTNIWRRDRWRTGRSMKFIVELSSITLLFGSIVAYQMIVGDLGSVVLSQIFDLTNSSILRALVILVLTCTISFPLSLSERFDHLTPISIQSIVFFLSFCFYTLLQLWINPMMDSFDSNKLIFWRWSGVFVSLPILSLSFSCQTMLFVVYSELPDSTAHAINDIIDLSVFLVGFIYFIVGLVGYIVFSGSYNSLPGNIMQIYPKNLFQQIFLWGFLLNCTTGIPFMVNPTRGSLFSLWNDQRRNSLFGERHLIPRRLFLILTAIVVFIPTLIAIFIPDLEFILALTGATGGQLICYILPAIITLHLKPHGTNSYKSQALMILGVVSLLVCTIMTFKAEMEKNESPSSWIRTSLNQITTTLTNKNSTTTIVEMSDQ